MPHHSLPGSLKTYSFFYFRIRIAKRLILFLTAIFFYKRIKYNPIHKEKKNQTFWIQVSFLLLFIPFFPNVKRNIWKKIVLLAGKKLKESAFVVYKRLLRYKYKNGQAGLNRRGGGRGSMNRISKFCRRASKSLWKVTDARGSLQSHINLLSISILIIFSFFFFNRYLFWRN